MDCSLKFNKLLVGSLIVCMLSPSLAFGQADLVDLRLFLSHDGVVYVDGGKVGLVKKCLETPFVIEGLLPGKHTLRVEKEHFQTFEREIVLELGKINSTEITLQPIRTEGQIFLRVPRSRSNYPSGVRGHPLPSINHIRQRAMDGRLKTNKGQKFDYIDGVTVSIYFRNEDTYAGPTTGWDFNVKGIKQRVAPGKKEYVFYESGIPLWFNQVIKFDGNEPISLVSKDYQIEKLEFERTIWNGHTTNGWRLRNAGSSGYTQRHSMPVGTYEVFANFVVRRTRWPTDLYYVKYEKFPGKRLGTIEVKAGKQTVVTLFDKGFFDLGYHVEYR